MSLAISGSAGKALLTELATIKAELQITDNSEDTWLSLAIARASAAVTRRIGVTPADDGSAVLGRESLVETQRLNRHRSQLVLSRFPVVSVSAVVQAGTTLETTDYEFDGATGVLWRLSSDVRCDWPPAKVVVTYSAGYLMPGETGRNLPFDLEMAVVGLIKTARFNRSRDPALRSENILEGLYAYTLFSAGEQGGDMPAEFASIVDAYRRIICL